MIKNLAGIVLLAASLMIFFVGSAGATDIAGTITTTLTITADSKLVGNVTCTVAGAPCIKFGANGIHLNLNGFIITGLANANLSCSGGANVPGEDGVDTNGKNQVEIEGPGIIRRFRNHGIFLNGGTKDEVEHVTLSSNCHTGIQVNSTYSKIKKNVSVRNGGINNPLGSGGIEVKGNNNHIAENEVGGNGLSPLPGFGIGLLGNSNVIEGNGITGNIKHGITVFPGATGNTVSRNIVMGNPGIDAGICEGANLVDIHDPGAASTLRSQ